MRAALFITCLIDTLYPQTGQATVAVLRRLGHDVEFPFEQTCCGQMHVNAGYRTEGIDLVRRFVDVFGEFETVVTPSGSCAAMVHDHYPRLAAESGDEQLVSAVRSLVPRVHELSQFLVNVLEVEDVGAYFPHRVTYHPACHGLRTLRVGDAPLRLLRAVRGIDLVELPDAETCCGFGGTFSVKNPEVSAAMLADKIGHVLGTEAEVCAGVDRSCLMQIGGGLERLHTGVRTVHLAEILASRSGPAR